VHADALILTVLAVLIGLFIGLLRRGRIRNLIDVQVSWWPLLIVGIAVPAVVDRVDGSHAWVWVGAALAALVVFAARNLRIVGMSVVAIGLACNLLPTVVNQGMPVRAEALVQARLVSPTDLDRVILHGARQLRTDDHPLWFLGDIVPVSETTQVVSFGDLIVLVGLADVAANLLLRQRVRRRSLPHGAEAALLSIAPPDDRLGSATVIDLRLLELAIDEPEPLPERVPAGANPLREAPTIDLRDPLRPIVLDLVAFAPESDYRPHYPGPPRPTRKRRTREIPDFDTIVLDEGLVGVG
jgi:hypothetical protein